MKSNKLNFRDLLLASAVALAFISATSCSADDDDLVPRILVTGEGQVDIPPDMAVLNLSVVREAKTAREALDANSNAMKEVLDAMKAEGIEDRDLQTSGFSVQPRYDYPAPSSTGERKAPRIVGYTVRNSLAVRVRDINSVGLILDKSITLGVNEGGGINFTNADPSEAITQARVLAVKDAQAKAQTLADAAGVKTGKLLEISEQSYSPRPMTMARTEMSLARSSDAVPVATGENTYKVTVNITFAIDQ